MGQAHVRPLQGGGIAPSIFFTLWGTKREHTLALEEPSSPLQQLILRGSHWRSHYSKGATPTGVPRMGWEHGEPLLKVKIQPLERVLDWFYGTIYGLIYDTN